MSTIASNSRSEPCCPRPRGETSYLLVGDWRLAEFATGLASTNLQTTSIVATINEACGQLVDCEVAPELILVAQALPGAIRQQDVDRLQNLAPLARIVIVAGTWCAGELRTGRPPTGVLRLYWHELGPWWHANERRLNTGLAPTWSAPLDHPQAGRFAVEDTTMRPPSPLVAIHADDYAVYECFADAGLRTVWTRGEAAHNAEAGVFDCGQLSDRELERLATFCRQVSGPVVVLVDFPRVEHVALAQEAGARAVFGKPFVVDEVIAKIAAVAFPKDSNNAACSIPSPHF